MDSVRKFIEETYNASLVYKHNIEDKLNICLGNVSCDMDSSIGVYILAYHLTHKAKYFDDIGNFENLYLPIVNCPRGELQARLDIHYHFDKYGIDVNKLVYIDDLDINYYAQNDLLSISIIDHNKLDITQAAWDKCVDMIVDHHVDTNAYDNKPGMNKILTFCGSACSLAFNLFYDFNQTYLLDKEVCMFFAPAILLDTENLNPALKGKKWGDVDELACQRIFRLFATGMYDTLVAKKTDRKLNIELGLELILRKDYKNYLWKNKYVAGISVVFNTFHELMKTFTVDKLKDLILERMSVNKLNVYMIITQTYDNDGKVGREFMFFNENEEELARIKKEFERLCTFPFKNKKFTGLTKKFAFYIIEDDSISRKKIEPIFQEIYEKIL